MTYVAYFECDSCGKREHTDLAPPGWTFLDVGDFCPSCSKAREEAAKDKEIKP